MSNARRIALWCVPGLLAWCLIWCEILGLRVGLPVFFGALAFALATAVAAPFASRIPPPQRPLVVAMNASAPLAMAILVYLFGQALEGF